jgi:nucleoid-associated protein YgaU
MGVFGFGKSIEEKEAEALAHFRASQKRMPQVRQQQQGDLAEPRSLPRHQGAGMSASRQSSHPPGASHRAGQSNGHPATTSGEESSELTSYTVQPGDSLSSIAHRLYGDGSDWLVIYSANRDLIRNPDRIVPGQVLKVPRRRSRQPLS